MRQTSQTPRDRPDDDGIAVPDEMIQEVAEVLADWADLPSYHMEWLAKQVCVCVGMLTASEETSPPSGANP